MLYKQSQPLIVPHWLPVDDGLVLYMPFQEGSGRFTADISGRDNHCTLVGVTWSLYKGKKGFAPTFDGIDDKGTFGKNMIPSSGDFAVMGWIYCEGDQAGDTDKRAAGFGSASWGGAASKGVLIARNNALLQVLWGDGTTAEVKTVIPDITGANKRKWFHVAAIYIAAITTMFGYVDAVEIDSGVHAYADSAQNFEIGHSSLNFNDSYWYGQLKHIRVYNRAVSIDELRKIYEAEK